MIKTYAQLCAASYDDSAPGFTNINDLRFGVVDAGDVVIVVFRGSSNVLNWIRDCSALPTRTRSGHYAHGGFVGSMEALRGAVAEQLAGHTKPIVYTGHSLGGAIAALFAQESTARAVTFGCPRVWWTPSAAPSIEHTRVICDDDPVPMIPHCLFKHDLTESVITLADQDGEWVNPEDHFITHYLARMAEGT